MLKLKPPYIRKLMSRHTIDIWLVDGKYVREHYYLDFTQGGHNFIYDFIPRFEIWIDDDLSSDERPAVIAHELYEQSLMHDGIDYNHAHTWANKIEAHKRGIKILTGRKND